MFFTCLLSLVLVVIFVNRLSKQWQDNSSTKSNRQKISSHALKRLAACNESGAAFAALIETEGAGSWPPRATHENWPAALQPFREIWNETAPLLPSADPCLDERRSRYNIDHFRSLMRERLQTNVDIHEVEKILIRTAHEDWTDFTREAYNGFYACIALCRHAYRWTSIPIVKAAQSDTVIDFPVELDLPWTYLQKSFGITADSGNNTSNVLCNYSINNERAFKFTTGISGEIISSEENFFRIFLDLEIAALPIYHEMVYAIQAFETQNVKICTTHLKIIRKGLRNLLQIYYQNMRNSKVGTKVWMRWVQGFQGWGAGRLINGQFTKFNGISASQVLFFQAIDAFLGMGSFLSDIDSERYIPVKQRLWVAALRRSSFRKAVSAASVVSQGEEDRRRFLELEAEFTKLVNQVKSFRAAHRTRCIPYLREPAPERMPMTAGMFQPKSNEKPSPVEGHDPFVPLIELLSSRLRATK